MSTNAHAPTVIDLKRYLSAKAEIVERALALSVAESDGPAAKLFEAMRYSLLLAASACVRSWRWPPAKRSAAIDAAMGLACALEMIHTYSLIHDDLPCMDDDDLRVAADQSQGLWRRDGYSGGRRPVDRRFRGGGAFVVSSNARVSPSTMLEVIAELSDAAGSGGHGRRTSHRFAGRGPGNESAQLEYLHSKKTGALFVAVCGGARLGGADVYST